MSNTLMSPLQAALENIRNQILQSGPPGPSRFELVGSIDFFQKQVLCETERRVPERVLVESWNRFERKFFKLCSEGRRKSLPSCRTVRGFVDPVPRSTVEVSEVFRSLLKSLRRVQGLSESEKSLCELGLRYLEAEARKPFSSRDQKHLRQSWKRIFPYLKKAGLLRRVPGVTFEVQQNLYQFLAGEGSVA